MQNETVKGGLRGNALILNTARKMWTSSSIRSFYRGLPMGLIGMFPYSAIDLTTFEYLKQFLTNRKARLHGTDEDDTTLSNFTTAGIGACSGAFGASVVYPLNLLRTRLQSQGTAIHPPTYTGMWDVTVKTVRGEGFRGLFKGITPNLLKVVPAVSITYVVYDNSKALLGLR
jgi:solute carrier family 25 phosphate transporter 23/24/25/41